MKLLKNLFPLFLVMLLWSSCDPDDGPIIGSTFPTSGIDNSSFLIDANGTFTVVLDATQGDSPLNVLTVQKDGVNIAGSDISIDGTAAASNDILLFGTDKTSFVKTVTITTDLAGGESASYSFIIAAENGDQTSETVFVEVEEANNPPTLELTGDIVESNDLFQIPLGAIIGSDSLNTIAVYEDGVLAAANRLTLGAMTVWSDNPYTLTGDLRDGFVETLIMSLPTTSGNYDYLIIVTSDSGLADSVAFTAEVNLGTPVDGGVAGIIMENFAGPNPTGGLDCTTGAVSGSSALAHIMDNGNDTNGDWAAQIKIGTAGSEMRQVTGAFSDYTTKEEIATAYGIGTGGSVFDVTAGDLYVVLGTDGVHYLVEFMTVNPTAADNLDFYTLNTKF